MKFRSTAIAAIAATAIMAGSVAPAVAVPSIGGTYQAPAKKPKITKQPKSASVASGKTASFSVKATGTSVKYQWYVKKANSKKWSKATGSTAKKSTYKVKAKTSNNGSSYRVIVKNSKGKATSKTVKLVTNFQPKLKTQPANATVVADKTASFTVSATGGGLKYQWYSKTATGKWAKASGSTAKTKTYKVKATVKASGSQYRVTVYNKKGKVTSKTATLVTHAKPIISTQPQSLYVMAGTTATFSVAATGNGLTYQWQRLPGDSETWQNISGATKPTLSFAAKTTNELDAYRVIIKNKAGAVTSQEVWLYIGSTTEQPMPLDRWFALDQWQAVFFDPENEVSTDDIGYTDMYISFDLYNWTTSALLPSNTLEIYYVGSDGEIYGPSGYYLTDDLDQLGFVAANGYASGRAFALVPTNVVKGGNWVIFDSINDEQYVIGTR